MVLLLLLFTIFSLLCSFANIRFSSVCSPVYAIHGLYSFLAFSMHGTFFVVVVAVVAVRSLVDSFCFGIMYVEIDLFSFHSPAIYIR